MTDKIKLSELEAEAQRLVAEGKMPSLQQLLAAISERGRRTFRLSLKRERNQMTPNKPPLAMTIHELFRELARVMDKQPAEREEFKRSWLEGAKRMNRETAPRREERLGCLWLDQRNLR